MIYYPPLKSLPIYTLTPPNYNKMTKKHKNNRISRKSKKIPAIQIELKNGKIIPFGKYSVKMARDYAEKGMEVGEA